jgi:hypothetical protein
MGEFAQYSLETPEGGQILIDVVQDGVYINQTSQGTHGRGALALTPLLAHELARQVEQAASVAASYIPEQAAPAAAASSSGVNSSPAMEAVLRQLGPQGLEAIIAFAEAARTAAAPPAPAQAPAGAPPAPPAAPDGSQGA